MFIATILLPGNMGFMTSVCNIFLWVSEEFQVGESIWIA